MPVGLDSTETLGRGVFSRGHIKPSKGKVKYQAFLEQGCSSLSVDRCDDALIDTLVYLGVSWCILARREPRHEAKPPGSEGPSTDGPSSPSQPRKGVIDRL